MCGVRRVEKKQQNLKKSGKRNRYCQKNTDCHKKNIDLLNTKLEDEIHPKKHKKVAVTSSDKKININLKKERRRKTKFTEHAAATASPQHFSS